MNDVNLNSSSRGAEPRTAAITVWVGASTDETSNDLLFAIRSQRNVDIRVLDMNVAAPLPGPHDLLLVNSQYLRALVNPGGTTPTTRPNVYRGGLPPHALRRVKAAIDERLLEGVSLSELAGIARLSECHFARAFKQSVGVPPHRYMLQRRLDFAAALICETDRQLTDVALAAGFSDHSHFTRCFVRYRGETPSAYRRRHR